MCFSATFGCCADEYVTIKAFDNSDPFDLNWAEKKAGPDFGEAPATGEVFPQEWCLSEWFGSAVLAFGSKDPNSAANTTNAGAGILRNQTTGATTGLSTSSPSVGPGAPSGSAAVQKTIIPPHAPGSGANGLWLAELPTNPTASNDKPTFYRWSGASPTSITQAAKVLPLNSSGNHVGIPGGVLLQTGTSLVVSKISGANSGPYPSSGVRRFLEKYDSSGAISATMDEDALSVSSHPDIEGYSAVFAIGVNTGLSPFILCCGRETTDDGGAPALILQYRRLWKVGATSLTESAANTVSSGALLSQMESYENLTAVANNPQRPWFHRPYTPDGSRAFVTTVKASDLANRRRLKCINTSSLTEVWSTIISGNSPPPHVMCATSSVVVVFEGFASVRGYSVTTGANLWTRTDLGGRFYGRVLTAGVAVFNLSSAIVLNPTTGVTVGTFDTNSTDVYEMGSQIFSVGPLRGI